MKMKALPRRNGKAENKGEMVLLCLRKTTKTTKSMSLALFIQIRAFDSYRKGNSSILFLFLLFILFLVVLWISLKLIFTFYIYNSIYLVNTYIISPNNSSIAFFTWSERFFCEQSLVCCWLLWYWLNLFWLKIAPGLLLSDSWFRCGRQALDLVSLCLDRSWDLVPDDSGIGWLGLGFEGSRCFNSCDKRKREKIFVHWCYFDSLCLSHRSNTIAFWFVVNIIDFMWTNVNFPFPYFEIFSSPGGI